MELDSDSREEKLDIDSREEKLNLVRDRIKRVLRKKNIDDKDRKQLEQMTKKVRDLAENRLEENLRGIDKFKKDFDKMGKRMKKEMRRSMPKRRKSEEKFKKEVKRDLFL